MTSVSEIGLSKCESCGHLIDRGRLTCRNCGAVSPVKQVITNIDFYKTIRFEAWKYLSVLRQLHDSATEVDVFIANDVLGEAHMSDFKKFWKSISLTQKSGAWRNDVWTSLRVDVKLFKTLIEIDKNMSFYRFVAIQDNFLTVCEINIKAGEYLDNRAVEERIERDIRGFERSIEEDEKEIVKQEALLEVQNAERLEVLAKIDEWHKLSWFKKRKERCLSIQALNQKILLTKEYIGKCASRIEEEEEKLEKLK